MVHLPVEKRTDKYLEGIAAKACGYIVHSRWKLRSWQASLLIDALRDRLAWAIKNKNRQRTEDQPCRAEMAADQ